jgi:hypothetical protein
MDYIPLPLDMLESKEYQSLTLAEKAFIIDLYAKHYDCETFTIDTRRPEDYHLPPKCNIFRKVNAMIDSGLVECIGLRKGGTFHYLRVLRFKYPAHVVFQKAA